MVPQLFGSVSRLIDGVVTGFGAFAATVCVGTGCVFGCAVGACVVAGAAVTGAVAPVIGRGAEAVSEPGVGAVDGDVVIGVGADATGAVVPVIGRGADAVSAGDVGALGVT